MRKCWEGVVTLDWMSSSLESWIQALPSTGPGLDISSHDQSSRLTAILQFLEQAPPSGCKMELTCVSFIPWPWSLNALGVQMPMIQDKMLPVGHWGAGLWFDNWLHVVSHRPLDCVCLDLFLPSAWPTNDQVGSHWFRSFRTINDTLNHVQKHKHMHAHLTHVYSLIVMV